MLIKNMLDDIGDEGISETNPIPIPNVCTALLLRLLDLPDWN